MKQKLEKKLVYLIFVYTRYDTKMKKIQLEYTKIKY